MEFLNNIISSGIISLESVFFIGSGFLGMISHYGKKRIKGQTKVSIKEYFGKNNPLSSFASLTTFVATMIGMVNGIDMSMLDTWVIVILGLTCGWTIDSGVNTVKEK